jgi:hypothetical protein
VVIFGVCLEWMKKTTNISVGLAGVWTEIRMEHFPNISLQRVRYTEQFGGSYIQSNLGLRTPRIKNNSVYEQIFRTQSVSDDVLCLELRTRKPSTSWSDKLGVSASAVFVEEWSRGKIPRVSNTDRRERQLLCSFRSLEFTVPSLEFQCVLCFL